MGADASATASGRPRPPPQVGNAPGQPVKPGSMGRPLPGLPVALVDPSPASRRRRGRDLPRPEPPPGRLMTGYHGDDERNADAMPAATTTPATSPSRDADGYITYVGRTDDVFKASDYRISPFELESVLIEHPAVAEAAVVPAPDPIAAGGAEGVRRAGAGLGAGPRDRAGRSCVMPGSTSRRTSGSAGWSSPSCRRRSPARSAGSSSGAASGRPRPRARPSRSGATRSFPSSASRDPDGRPSRPDARSSILPGRRTPDAGTPDAGRRTPDAGRRTPDAGRRTAMRGRPGRPLIESVVRRGCRRGSGSPRRRRGCSCRPDAAAR